MLKMIMMLKIREALQKPSDGQPPKPSGKKMSPRPEGVGGTPLTDEAGVLQCFPNVQIYSSR